MHTYVLDTNVLLHSPKSIFSFAENKTILPLASLDELDRFKTKSDELGRNARAVSRLLDELRTQGSLLEGVKTPDGGILQVKTCDEEVLGNIPIDLSGDVVDNVILAVAISNHAILVTQDINLRIKAAALGIESQEYRTGKVTADESYEGHAEVVISGEQMAELFSGGTQLEGYYENQCLTLYCESNLNHTALGIVKNNIVRPIRKEATIGVSKIHPQNREQQLALELLLDDSIPLVTISGRSGCGKSLLTLAAGLSKVQDGTYSRMLVSKPTISVGGSKNDIGFLPGEMKDKLSPWLNPIKDNLDIICGVDSSRNKSKRSMFDELEDQGLIQAEALSFLRGRSLQKQIFWLDESQNISPSEAKTLLTRIGEGSRCVLTGDLDQIDSPYLDSENNGLAIVINRFKESSLAGHITLKKGVRSPLSEAASMLL